ncbi:MAG: chemotaxis protein CheX [Polyangiaceae bacterium]
MTATETDIADIVQTVTTAFFGVEAAVLPSIPPPQHTGTSEMLVGCVTVDGAWRGAVTVSCPRRLATRIAAVMFGCDETKVTPECSRDALCEMTNVVGGNIKSLFASVADEACHLSLPIASEGGVSFPGARVVHHLRFNVGADTLRVTVLEVPTSRAPAAGGAPCESYS